MTDAWSTHLWGECERLAAGLDGADVIRALNETSVAVWDAGLDHAFGAMRQALATSGESRMTLDTAASFDATWLSVFAVKLNERQRKPERCDICGSEQGPFVAPWGPTVCASPCKRGETPTPCANCSSQFPEACAKICRAPNDAPATATPETKP